MAAQKPHAAEDLRAFAASVPHNGGSFAVTNFRFLPSFNSIIHRGGIAAKLRGLHKKGMTDDHDESGVMWLWIICSILFIVVIALSLYIALCMCGCCYDPSLTENQKADEDKKANEKKKNDKDDDKNKQGTEK